MCPSQSTHRIQRGITHQRGNSQQQCGGQNFTDTVNQLARRHRQPVGYAEKHYAEHRQTDTFIGFADKRHYTDFKRYRRGTRRSKQRADGQIQCGGKRNAVPRTDTRSQGLNVARTGITDGNHTEQRQTGTGQQKAEHGRQPVFTGLLPQICRKNQIARAKKQSKQHQADSPQRGFLVST